MKHLRIPALLGLLLCHALASAQTPEPAVIIAPAAETPLGTGPYKALMEVRPELPIHTVYRPADLSAVKAKLPVVIWGNGGCRSEGERARPFLTEIASRGYVVIVAGPIGGIAPQPGADPNAAGLRAKDMIDGLNWAAATERDRSSPFHRKLDLSRVAAMGHSCGGVMALEAGLDPRVKTVVMWNSGMFPDSRARVPGVNITKAALGAIHGPIAWFTGDQESDYAHSAAADDFARMSGRPAFQAYKDKMKHGGTYRESDGGEFAPIAVAWLNWTLHGDKAAGRMFAGSDCGLCRAPGWHVQKKNIP